MSNNENHRAQIDKYLKGELDARAMHKLEREAQDDPFLMDALDGYEANGKDQQLNLSELQQRLTDRITPKKERSILLWRVLPIAAALLLMIGIGYWELIPKPASNKQMADLIKPQPQGKQPTIIQPETKVPAPKPKNISATRSIPPVIQERGLPEPAKQGSAIAYNKGKKEIVDELLKRMPGVEVGADGSITHQGQPVTKARINGKDFMGGNVAQATKNLPADIIDKIQVIDDYGDQANKTGVKSGDPHKLLNITTNKTAFGKDSLLANNLAKAAPQVLREVAISKPRNIVIRGAGNNELKKLPDSSSVTPALEGKIAGVNIDKAKATVNKKITGRITGKDDGKPIAGVTIKVKGTNGGTQTNINGEFALNLLVAGQTLTANYIGYQQQEIVVKSQDKINIELSPSERSLSEVVVVGYGTQTKRDVTGSVATVAAADTTDNSAHPAIGNKAYKNYLQQNSKVTGSNTGKVKLAFTVDARGGVNNIHVIKSTVPELNQRAIYLIKKGPAWVGAKNGKLKEIRIKIKFHK